MGGIVKEHKDTCSCGHDHSHCHDHSHEHDHSHCHDHSHEHDHDHCHCHDQENNHGESSAALLPKGVKKRIYILENLGCANCAAKMELKINELPEVEKAVITYATKQLAVASDSQEDLLSRLQQICASIEDGVVVTAREDTEVKRREKRSVFEENKKDILAIATGIALFTAGLILQSYSLDVWMSAAFFAAYAVMGCEIVWTAVKNLGRGHV